MSSLYGRDGDRHRGAGGGTSALQATTNNVANVNTPGYSRLRPVLVENQPIVLGSVTYGSGVSLRKLQSLRDPILQLRIQEETQQQGQLNASVTALQQAQVQFTTSSGDIGTEIANFFSSLSQLSSDPTNLGLRQGVLTAAANLSGAFNNTANNLLPSARQPGPQRRPGCAASQCSHWADCHFERPDQPVAGGEPGCQFTGRPTRRSDWPAFRLDRRLLDSK